MTIVFMPDGSTITGDPIGIYPKRYNQRSNREPQVGDLMDDDLFHPLVYPS